MPSGNGKNTSRLERLAQRAALTLAFERLWPVVVSVMVSIAVFVTLSWLGLWLEVPPWAKMAGVAGFSGILLYLAFSLLRTPRPTKAQALSRLDRDSGFAHRPASSLQDGLANAGSDPATRALWDLHQKRLAAQTDRLKLAAPSPRMVDKDRFAVRAAALVALVGAGFVAGPERFVRVAAAFDWRSASVAASGFRVDAWLNPPAYTGRAPILLEARASDKKVPLAASKIDAPVGSTLVLRGPVDDTFNADITGGLALAMPETAAANQSRAVADNVETFQLKGDAKLVLQRAGNSFAAFEIHAIPDNAPVIAFVDPLQPNERGSMTLNYKISDDYGVIAAEAYFTKPVSPGKAAAGRSLADPPRIALTLPAAPGGLGEGSTTADLSDHPWAGARVMMVLSARDEGGNFGMSEAREVVLPQRVFTKPMARALVEQRRNLVLSPDERSKVAASLDALTIGADEFHIGTSVYLGLATAQARLRVARTDEHLLGVADFLWEMALRIEEGDLSQSERDLRAAQERLREALQRGATDEELSKLMADVRAALDKFMKELADKLQREGAPQQQAERSPRNGRVMTPQDFKSMMDKIEEAARTGDKAEAKRLLDQMQRMLENLQTARPRGPSQAQREMNQALDELDALAREEQNLRDDTFKQDQKQRRPQRNAGKQPDGSKQPNGQPNRPRPNGEKPGQSPDDSGDADNAESDGSDTGDAQSAEQAQQGLKDRQEALRKRLEQLQKRLSQLGQKGKDGLGEAQEAMRDAENALGEGQGNAGRAVGPQGKALEALRKGAQQLAEAMQQQGEGEGDDQASDDGQDQPGQGQRQGNRQNGGNRDPLGREDQRNDQMNREKRGLNDQGAPAQRAQRVLEELRKRLGDTSRGSEERDYLERLLKR